jgi:hypothetical protein
MKYFLFLLSFFMVYECRSAVLFASEGGLTLSDYNEARALSKTCIWPSLDKEHPDRAPLDVLHEKLETAGLAHVKPVWVPTALYDTCIIIETLKGNIVNEREFYGIKDLQSQLEADPFTINNIALGALDLKPSVVYSAADYQKKLQELLEKHRPLRTSLPDFQLTKHFEKEHLRFLFNPFRSREDWGYLLNSIRLEVEAKSSNKVVLYRATSGSQTQTGFQLENPVFQGGIHPLSFSYSLLSGFLFDTLKHGTSGCSYTIYAKKRDSMFLYALVLDQRTILAEEKISLWLPGTSLTEGVFSSGEEFHPRTRGIYRAAQGEKEFLSSLGDAIELRKHLSPIFKQSKPLAEWQEESISENFAALSLEQ